jgi:hypothetical protein
VEAPQQRIEHGDELRRQDAVVLARCPWAGEGAGQGFDPHLGVAVELPARAGAEHFLAAGPQVIRQKSGCRHVFSVRVAQQPARKGPEIGTK